VEVEAKRIDPGRAEVVAPSAKVVVETEQDHVAERVPDGALGAFAAQGRDEVRVADVQRHGGRRAQARARQSGRGPLVTMDVEAEASAELDRHAARIARIGSALVTAR
jgi:hypothetical protein